MLGARKFWNVGVGSNLWCVLGLIPGQSSLNSRLAGDGADVRGYVD